MGTGKLSDRALAAALEAVGDLPGDFAEIGVYRGHLFDRLAWVASMQERTAHAFDSFQGMAEPGPLDREYPRGMLACSEAEFRRRITAPADSWRVWPGFIPECFSGCDAVFAFAWVDVDHYQPTKDVLAWVWPRMAPGGILGLDDYFPGRRKLATPAIEEFLESITWASISANDNDQLFIRSPSLRTGEEPRRPSGRRP